MAELNLEIKSTGEEIIRFLPNGNFMIEDIEYDSSREDHRVLGFKRMLDMWKVVGDSITFQSEPKQFHLEIKPDGKVIKNKEEIDHSDDYVANLLFLDILHVVKTCYFND